MVFYEFCLKQCMHFQKHNTMKYPYLEGQESINKYM